MNVRVIGIVFTLPLFCTSLGIWSHGFRQVHMGYKRFSQMSGFLAEETLPWAHQCNKLHFTICIVLLSEFVSQNAWLQQAS